MVRKVHPSERYRNECPGQRFTEGAALTAWSTPRQLPLTSLKPVSASKVPIVRVERCLAALVQIVPMTGTDLRGDTGMVRCAPEIG